MIRIIEDKCVAFRMLNNTILTGVITIENSMIRILKDEVKHVINHFPLQNLIIFESLPDCTGNTKAVFDELVKRGINKKYFMVWRLANTFSRDHEKIFHVFYIREGFLLNFCRCIAKMSISENCFIRKEHEGQYAFCIFHAGAFKRVTDYYTVPEYVDEIVSLSPFLVESDANCFGCKKELLNPLGFPRNDILFDNKPDLKWLFPGREFNKLIYWMPTFRQHRNKTRIHSSITIPIIHDTEAANIINTVARENNVLVVVKPHFAQDINRIKALNLSNLIFIDDDFLMRNRVANYELLASSDALLTDYSSVYYDYILKDAPIGLCWEDFEEYKIEPGFVLDPEMIMAAGEKIYITEDLCAFIRRIANGEDILKEKRKELKRLLFPCGAQKSTARVADRVLEILEHL